ncbi:MAG: hypothetical protein Ct9H300mP16_03190 [Pseudomonadota bacterium]|nr:MAG: hypothetical protein Ct9H300mP16_03190 [Pseudomonadota bacterium]
MLQLLVRRATLIGQTLPVDIGCSDGRIVEVSARIEAEAEKEIEPAGAW